MSNAIKEYCQQCRWCRRNKLRNMCEEKDIVGSMKAREIHDVASVIFSDPGEGEKDQPILMTVMDEVSKYSMTEIIPDLRCDTISAKLKDGWVKMFGPPNYFKFMDGDQKAKAVSKYYNQHMSKKCRQRFACGEDSYAQHMLGYFCLSIVANPGAVPAAILDAVHNSMVNRIFER